MDTPFGGQATVHAYIKPRFPMPVSDSGTMIPGSGRDWTRSA